MKCEALGNILDITGDAPNVRGPYDSAGPMVRRWVGSIPDLRGGTLNVCGKTKTVQARRSSENRSPELLPRLLCPKFARG